MMNRSSKRPKKLFTLLLGPLLFLLILILPIAGTNLSIKAAVGCVLWMGCWWITTPVGVAVTAFIPIVVNAVLQVLPMSDVISNYFSEIVVLLLGADLIAISWEETGLDKRLSLKALCLIGPSATQQIVVWFLLSTVLSMFLPNAVVCAIMVPVAVSMLRYLLDGDIMSHPISPVILAAIAWGGGIGGLGTPLGGAMNLISVDYLEQLLGHEFMYMDWIVRLVPFLVMLVAVDIAYLMFVKPKGVSLNGTKDYFRQTYQELPKMSRDEAWSLGLFLAATLLSFARELFAAYLPAMKPAYLFLICGMLTFVIPKTDGQPLLTWKTAEKKVGWSLLLLFAGGLAVGKLISDSGAAAAIAALLTSLDLGGGFLTMLVLVASTVVLAEIASNTAAAAISLPIVISVTQGLGLDPVPYVFVISAAFNVAYMLPTSIRAIPCGYGLPPAYLFKRGGILTAASILLIALLGQLALPLLSLA